MHIYHLVELRRARADLPKFRHRKFPAYAQSGFPKENVDPVVLTENVLQ